MVKIRGEARILIDCEGHVDSDVYINKDDIESFKIYLEGCGFKITGIFNDEKSFETQRPFRYYKPSVQKRVTREVDWENPEVIFEVLTNKASDSIVLKKVIDISGKVKSKDSKATEFTIIAPHRYIEKEYSKWKEENNITETPQNKKELVKKFSVYYVEAQKKLKQKRLQPGTLVYVRNADQDGVVIKYENENYTIKLNDGFQGVYQRKDLNIKIPLMYHKWFICNNHITWNLDVLKNHPQNKWNFECVQNHAMQ